MTPSPGHPPDRQPGRRPERHGPDISAAQVAGSALAAVSAAVVASFLGVGGTIIGAALGSVVASVGGAVYSHSFKRAGTVLGETRVLTVVARPRAGPAGPTGPDGDPDPAAVPALTDPAEEPLRTEPQFEPTGLHEPVVGEPPQAGPLPAPGGRVPRRISWKGAVALTVLAFVLAVGAIEAFEVFLGRPISGGSGGTTISHLVKPKPKHTKPAPTPTPTTTPTTSPGSTATSTPTSTSTATGTPTAPPPTSTPTSTPTDSSTASPTSTGPVAPSTTPAG